MTLVDTSVWIDHLRRHDPALAGLLEDGAVLMHPCVFGELACGGLRRRDETLALLKALPVAATADDRETLALVERRGLHGRGLGWIDAHLLAAALLTGCRLWTRDRALARAAADLGLDGSASDPRAT
ncbi:MAG: PIN domain-containing protein [Candidatus Latescibacteria bacterium]|nr:PIN domain-containing protein [Candidatus Latescibacterota bacterium]